MANLPGLSVEARFTLINQLNQNLPEVERAELAWSQRGVSVESGH
ncbi:MAG: hypothetical protein LZF60_50125 [Nitrospira sp.]|nr:MAG: hypothetical protein LZF60_50125 [Nitrospira sp.]